MTGKPSRYSNLFNQRMSDESATIAPAISVGTTSTGHSSASTDAFRTECGNVKQDPNLKNATFFYNILAGIGNKLEVSQLLFRIPSLIFSPSFPQGLDYT